MTHWIAEARRRGNGRSLSPPCAPCGERVGVRGRQRPRRTANCIFAGEKRVTTC